MELVGAFTHTLESLSPIEGGDKMRRGLGLKGDFDIKSFYGALRGTSSITFPWNSIWGVKAPCCVSFFVWTVAWGKVLTTNHLRKRGCIIMDWYCLCKCNGRVDHLLLHCGKVFRLWSFALRSFGVSWVLPKRVIDLLASWRNWLGKCSSNVWNLVPHCMMWIIWRERNNCIFEDLVLFGDKLLTLFATLCLIGLVHGDLRKVMLLHYL